MNIIRLKQPKSCRYRKVIQSKVKWEAKLRFFKHGSSETGELYMVAKFPWQVVKLITESAVSNGINYQDMPGKFYELLVKKQGVTHEDIEKFMATLEKVTRKSDLAILFAKKFIPESIDDYLTLAFTAKNLEQAIHLLSKYKWLLHPSVDLTVSVEGDFAYIRYQSSDGFPILDKYFYAEGLFSCMYHRVLDVTGVDFTPEKIFFRHGITKHHDKYAEYFRCPVIHDHDVDTFVVHKDILTLPFNTHDPEASHQLQCEADIKINQTSEFLVQVNDTLNTKLADDSYGIEDLAVAMNMSKRSLQRKLKQHGLTFSLLKNNLRIKKAKQRLNESQFTSDLIAEELGFLNGHSFRQFFKKQTGQNINEFRVQSSSAMPC